MNRYAATLAATVAVTAALLTTGPAQADDTTPPCAYSVPSLPGECLTQPVYDYLIGLQSDRALLTQQLAASRSETVDQSVVAGVWHDRFIQASLERQDAVEQVAKVAAQVTAAQKVAEGRLQRIFMLRGKVNLLRAELAGS